MVAFRNYNKNTERDLFSLEKLTSKFHSAAEYSHQLNPEEGFLLLFSLKFNTGAPGEVFYLVPLIFAPRHHCGVLNGYSEPCYTRLQSQF